MLDYCTLVSPNEFARAYLTIPFAFPSVPRIRSGPASLSSVTAVTSEGGALRPPAMVPSGGASAESLRPSGRRVERKDSLRERAARQLMGLSSLRQGSLP